MSRYNDELIEMLVTDYSNTVSWTLSHQENILKRLKPLLSQLFLAIRLSYATTATAGEDLRVLLPSHKLILNRLCARYLEHMKRSKASKSRKGIGRHLKPLVMEAVDELMRCIMEEHQAARTEQVAQNDWEEDEDEMLDPDALLNGAGGGNGAEEEEEQQESNGPSIAELLDELSLGQYLPNFQAEGVDFDDLLLLKPADLKALIPKMGPRRRLVTKIQQFTVRNELEQGNAAPEVPVGAGAMVLAAPQAEENAIAKDPNGRPVAPITEALEAMRQELAADQQFKLEGVKKAATKKYKAMEKEISAANKANRNLSKELAAATRSREKLVQEIELLKAQVGELKAQVTETEEKKEQVIVQSKAHIAKIKKEAPGKLVNGIMETMYTSFKSNFISNELYDGKQVVTLAKKCMKETSAHYKSM